MKSLVIGGTSSLGKYLSEELISRNAELITISRSPQGLVGCSHLQCDVLDQDKLRSILGKIRETNSVIDSLWCVAGYAYPRKVEEQTPEVMRRHLDRNFTYVKTALENIEDNLSKSENSLIVTLGSQWSYRPITDCPELTPYSVAKICLMRYTQDFASAHPRIRANHYCIPSTDTEAYRRIEETFKKNLGKEMRPSCNILANPVVIAKNLVEHALSFRRSGKTLIVNPEGLIELLN